MDNGKVLERLAIDTIRPLDCLPRYFYYIHALASREYPYVSEGRYRPGEAHCIFHYTLRGHGECWCASHRERVGPGQGFLSVINDPDSGYRYPGDTDEEWEFLVFCFDQANTLEVTEELIRHYGLVYALPHQNPALQELADEERWRREGLLTGFEGGRLYYGLLNELIRTAALDDPQPIHPIITQARQLVRQQLAGNPSVDQIAAQVGVSREHLSRVFHQYTRKGLKAYIDEERIRLVCRYLNETNQSVEELGQLLSFSSASNFIRFFKSHLGMTPQEYRKLGIPPAV